jgi:hypothetical protein
VAPRSKKALAVETNVYDGRMTSSPGSMSQSRAAISSAEVQEVVSSTRVAPNARSINSWHSRVNGPSPPIWPSATLRATAASSSPTTYGRLKGMR